MNVHLRATAPQSTDKAVAILNGFGRTLGDGVIGLQALHAAMQIGAIPARPVLYRLPNLPSMVQQLYAAAEFAETRILPWHHATPETTFEPENQFDSVIDIRDFAFDPDFLRHSMIDFFLSRLSVEPASLPPASRRNAWLASRVKTERGNLPHGYILVCPRAATPLRDMPETVHARILQRALAIGPVVTQGPVPNALRDHVLHAPPCATLVELCSLIRNARAMISTDTAMVHLADAFDVPCLAFFPTHLPTWRVRDYPNCVPIALKPTLPAGTEFARDLRDHALAQTAWFPNGPDLGWLDDPISAIGNRLHPQGTLLPAI